MSKPGPDRPQSPAERDRGPWGRRAITLLLLLFVIVAGMTVYGSRQQWWEMYLNYVGR